MFRKIRQYLLVILAAIQCVCAQLINGIVAVRYKYYSCYWLFIDFFFILVYLFGFSFRTFWRMQVLLINWKFVFGRFNGTICVTQAGQREKERNYHSLRCFCCYWCLFPFADFGRITLRNLITNTFNIVIESWQRQPINYHFIWTFYCCYCCYCYCCFRKATFRYWGIECTIAFAMATCNKILNENFAGRALILSFIRSHFDKHTNVLRVRE